MRKFLLSSTFKKVMNEMKINKLEKRKKELYQVNMILLE